MLFSTIGRDSSYLIALDVLTGRTTRFKITQPTYGMAFVDPNRALASVGKDLVWVDFSQDGNHKFSVQQNGSQDGILMAAYDGVLVHCWDCKNETSPQLRFAGVTVPVEREPSFVVPSKSGIWMTTYDNRVFRLGYDGSKNAVQTGHNGEIIGAGWLESGIWIAYRDGQVVTFGEEHSVRSIWLPE
jgi:hypothetical protein